MGKSIYESIRKKSGNANSYSECREVLTDDELAILGIQEARFCEELEENDECLVKDILLLLKASRRCHCEGHKRFWTA